MIGITVILSEIVGENGANGDKFLYHKVCLAPTTLDRPYSLPLKSKVMAEDIKMNVFPQVTSAEYIYGELVDGSQIKIKKSDLACLIGAVIYSSSITDLDKIETSGIYPIGDKCENVPSGSEQTQGCILFHLHWDINCSKQLYFTYNGAIFYRFKTRFWSDWKKISFTS
nr:MAG TPA: hypothetical protein [Bacteriophage sp.]